MCTNAAEIVVMECGSGDGDGDGDDDTVQGSGDGLNKNSSYYVKIRTGMYKRRRQPHSYQSRFCDYSGINI